MLVTTHANGEDGVSLPDFAILRDQPRQARLAAGTAALGATPRRLLG